MQLYTGKKIQFEDTGNFKEIQVSLYFQKKKTAIFNSYFHYKVGNAQGLLLGIKYPEISPSQDKVSSSQQPQFGILLEERILRNSSLSITFQIIYIFTLRSSSLGTLGSQRSPTRIEQHHIASLPRMKMSSVISS